MLPKLAIIEGAYFRDILDQPRALEETLRGLENPSRLQSLATQVNKAKFKRIILTGMGASYHALHPLNLQLVDHGLTPIMAETSELVHYESRFFDPRTLIIAVSQSGRSAEMIRLLQVNHRRARVIAVTNTPNSPLARRADAVVLTRAGEEFSVSCKTYVAALMALRWLGDLLCQRDLRRTRKELELAAPAVAAYLDDWENHVQFLCKELRDIRHLLLVGRGASLAAVGAGALIVKESDHFHAEGMSSAAFRHGPFEMLSQEIFVLVFAGDSRTKALNKRLCEDIRQEKGRAELAGRDGEQSVFCLPRAPRSLLPLMEILPVQMITLALAAQAGREPGRFELASKVTTTE